MRRAIARVAVAARADTLDIAIGAARPIDEGRFRARRRRGTGRARSGLTAAGHLRADLDPGSVTRNGRKG